MSRALEGFKIQDGDKIRISPILPYSEQTVYLDGHVVHPGKHAYREGMRIADLIPTYTDLLPEPSPQHAEIIRLAPPDYSPQVIAFNLAEGLIGAEKGGTGGTSKPTESAMRGEAAGPACLIETAEMHSSQKSRECLGVGSVTFRAPVTAESRNLPSASASPLPRSEKTGEKQLQS